MPTYLIKLVQSSQRPQNAHALPERFRFSGAPFDSVDVLNVTTTMCDLSLGWTENKFLHNVIRNGEETDFTYAINRIGYISFRTREHLCYVSRFGKRANFLSSSHLADLELKPLPINLTSQLESEIFKGQTFTDARITDLPVDRIPSLKVEIPTSGVENIVHLVRNTPAKVTSLTFELREGVQITLQAGGTIKYRSNEETSWSSLISEIHKVIKSLNLNR